jgi:hypothetical protein
LQKKFVPVSDFSPEAIFQRFFVEKRSFEILNFAAMAIKAHANKNPVTRF